MRLSLLGLFVILTLISAGSYLSFPKSLPRLQPGSETVKALAKKQVLSEETVMSGLDAGALTVNVAGLDSDQGTVRISLYDREETYLKGKRSFRHGILPIKDGKAKWSLSQVPHGTYAVMLYHDKNTNEKFDQNRIGIPKEDYGFSNNARPRLGLPDYDKVSFLLQEPSHTLEITIQ